MSHTREVLAAYKANFGPFPSDGRSFSGAHPIKFAVARGVVPDLLLAMQEAIERGQPLDVNAFVRRVEQYEARDPRCLWPEDSAQATTQVPKPSLRIGPSWFDQRVVDYVGQKLSWD